jgi:hypothetical protein
VPYQLLFRTEVTSSHVPYQLLFSTEVTSSYVPHQMLFHIISRAISAVV